MNFYKLPAGPVQIAFSGGRSSAYLLHNILEANNGLTDETYVIFNNTGKERTETLDFVQECSSRWSVPVIWLEYDAASETKYRVVNHNEASRNGEPFESLAKSKDMDGVNWHLPNPSQRFCTVELKVRTAKRYMVHEVGAKNWITWIGYRADEWQRIRGMKNENARQRWESEAPMYRAGVTKRDVERFWRAQPFDLRLPMVNGTTPHGNCDLCFLKGAATVEALIQEDPAAAEWWIKMEAGKAKFRNDRLSYAAMTDKVARQGRLDLPEQPGVNCFCAD